MEMENKNLTNEEAEQVLGGAGEEPEQGIISSQCPYCAEYKDFYKIDETYKYRHYHCGKCGDMTYLKLEYRWVHGIV